MAAAHGQCHAVEALIRSGASASAQTDVYNSTKQGGQRGGETPLHWIVQLRYNPEDLMYVRREQELHSGHIMAARKLLGRDKGGADVNAQSVRRSLSPPARPAPPHRCVPARARARRGARRCTTRWRTASTT